MARPFTTTERTTVAASHVWHLSRGMPNAKMLNCRMTGRPRTFPLPAIGDRFGRLVVVGEPERGHRGATSVPCRCDCGQERTVDFTTLRTGETRSCGCLKRERFGRGRTTHGLSRTPLYRVWCGMRERCANPSHTVYRYYGGKGVRVCDEWEADYAAFHLWATENGYRPGLEIDRIDSNGNYSPSNCRWTTRDENIRNRSVTILITAFGETKTAAERATDARCVVNALCLKHRVAIGWPAEKAIITPAMTITQSAANARAHKQNGGA